MLHKGARVGYIAKVFPRRSETFVVNELLAHEAAGMDVDVFSLRPSGDVGAHASHARLRADVVQLPSQVLIGDLLDEAAACSEFVSLADVLEQARTFSPREALHALLLARHVRQRELTHLHAHFANIAAQVTRLAAQFAGVPYSLTCHAKDIFCDDVDTAMLGALIDDAAAVITVSEFNVRFLSERFPEAAERIHRVYNGLELEHFSYTSPADRPPVIVGVGRLVEKKGFDDLLRACALLRDAGRSFSCTIVGSGAKEAELHRLAADLHLDGIVTFTGAASQEEVRAQVGGAAVMAVPCVVAHDGNRDGLPTVLVEAMALGTPCVATPVTGIAEVIDHERNGLLVPERSPVELAAALARLLDAPAERVRVAEAARQLVEDEFDAAATTARWRQIVGSAARTPTQENSHAHRVPVR
jgi:colanic acid/amylovoran biosynthesis glycosyltransferase